MESTSRTHLAEATTAELDGSSSLVKSLEKTFEDLRNLVTCQICVKPMYEPYMIACGHSFCYSCLAQWFSTHRRKETCPDCRMKVNRPPAPAYVIRQMTHLFVSKAELMPAGETTADHTKAQMEEAEIIQQDKLNQDHRVGGLFRGSFRPSTYSPRDPINDQEDGVQRCPACTWELENGRCNFCHAAYPGMYSEESDLSRSEGSEYDVNSDEWSLDGDISLDEDGQSIHAADEPAISTNPPGQQLPTHRPFHPFHRPFVFGRTAAHGLHGRPIPRHGPSVTRGPNRRGPSSALSEVTNTTDDPTRPDDLDSEFDGTSEDQYDAGSLADFVEPDTPYQDHEDDEDETAATARGQYDGHHSEYTQPPVRAHHGHRQSLVTERTAGRRLGRQLSSPRRNEETDTDTDTDDVSSISSDSSDSDTDIGPVAVPMRNRKRRRIIDDDEDEESDSRSLSEADSPRSRTRPRIESSSSTAGRRTPRSGTAAPATPSDPALHECSSPERNLSPEPERQSRGRSHHLIREAMGRSFSRIGITREVRAAPARRVGSMSAYSAQNSRTSGMPANSLASRLVSGRHSARE